MLVEVQVTKLKAEWPPELVPETLIGASIVTDTNPQGIIVGEIVDAVERPRSMTMTIKMRGTEA